MAKGKDVHAVHRGDDGWAVQKEGNERASSLHDILREAEKAATPLTRNEGSEVVIHRPDGRIRDSDSYGNGPNPPKDKKH